MVLICPNFFTMSGKDDIDGVGGISLAPSVIVKEAASVGKKDREAGIEAAATVFTFFLGLGIGVPVTPKAK